jgi:hypothetical protein
MQLTVTFDPYQDEMTDVLNVVASTYGYTDVEQALGHDAEEDDEAADTPVWGGWTARKMTRYVSALQPHAQMVLRVIAENAPHIAVADVQDAVTLGGPQYGGAMSSFGHAANNTRGVGDKPFAKVGLTYQINPEVAKLALDALDALGV